MKYYNYNIKIDNSYKVYDPWELTARLELDPMIKNYWFIYHDKDKVTKEDIDKYIDIDSWTFKDSGKIAVGYHLGDIKQEHIHLVVQYKSQRSERAIRAEWQGCHVEPTREKDQSIKYLMHIGHEDKYQYSREEVYTNDSLGLDYAIAKTTETFYPDKIISYINEGCETITDFYIRFGSYIKNYLYLINNLIKEK